jgi:hypothetical protein
MAKHELHRMLEALRRLESDPLEGNVFIGGDGLEPEKVYPNPGEEIDVQTVGGVTSKPNGNISKGVSHSGKYAIYFPPENRAPGKWIFMPDGAKVHVPDGETLDGSAHEAKFYPPPSHPNDKGKWIYNGDGSIIYLPPGVRADATGFVRTEDGQQRYVGHQDITVPRDEVYDLDDSLLDYEQECKEEVEALMPAWNSLATQTVTDSIQTHVQNLVKFVKEAPTEFDELWIQHINNPKRWNRITDPRITVLIIPSERWKYSFIDPKNPGNQIYAPIQHKGTYGPKDIWILNNMDSLMSWITYRTGQVHKLYWTELAITPYIPHGLHVFKPLCKDLFAKACEDLYNLYLKEDLNPHEDISPDRMDGGGIPDKTMLFYSYNDRHHDHFLPVRHVKQVVNILRREGAVDLASYAMEHVSALARVTNTDLDMLVEYGSLMFIRYAPGEGFKSHVDGTERLGPKQYDDDVNLGGSPGPILNITMGVEGEKVLDFIPALGYTDTNKRPIRVRCEPGEGILMYGESRVEWTHSIPEDDPHWRFTMAIKLPGRSLEDANGKISTQRLFPNEERPGKFRMVYNLYDLNASAFRNVSVLDQSHNISPLPKFNYRQNHLQQNGDQRAKQQNRQRAQYMREEKQKRGRIEGSDDAVSVASTMSHASNASRNGFKVPSKEGGWTYGPNVGIGGARRGGNGRGGGRDSRGGREGRGGGRDSRGGREGRNGGRDSRGDGAGRGGEFPNGVGKFSLIPGAVDGRQRW